jgi:DNA-binding MarR family transcriptional regulator
MMKRIDDFYRGRFKGDVGAAQLTRLLMRLQHTLMRIRMEVAKDSGLTSGAMLILFILRAYHPEDWITPRELSDATMMSSGGVTKVLHSLEDRDLVRRLQHPSDARSTIIGLTEAGVALVESIMPVVESKDRVQLFDALTKDESMELFRLLSKLDAAASATSIAAFDAS